MSSKTFKLSTIAVFVFAAVNANAALYRVVEVTGSGAEEYYGTAIGDSGADDSCFDTGSNCITNEDSGSGYLLAGDTQNGTQGFSLKKEVPLGLDNHFYYLDHDDLEVYCEDQLKYSTCEAWAYWRWYGSDGYGGLERERNAFDQDYYETQISTNLTAFDGTNSTYTFTPGTDSAPGQGETLVSGTEDKVVNKIDDSGNVIGNTSSGYYNYGGNYIQLYRHRGYHTTDGSDANTTMLLPKADTSYSTKIQNLIAQMGRTMAFDSFTYDGSTYIVGSASVAPFDYTDSDKDYVGDLDDCVTYDNPALYEECQNFAFATKAFFWEVGSETTNYDSVVDWETSYANYDEASSQATVRAAVVPPASKGTTYDERPVLVGFNTDRDGDSMMMQAAIFTPIDNTATFAVADEAWETTFISNATLEISGDYTYTNSVATDINENLIVIGESKLRGDNPENGSAANKMFVADADATTPTATYFNDLSEGIFFSGAGGKANAINNYNEIVGQVDAETHREINGKQRRKRGFIFPYNTTNTDTDRRAIFGNQAWWLDDLTNGGTYSSSNNKFRIIEAGDINDAGVISATALKCASGYDNTSHFSYCGGGDEDELIVAVKLIPIEDATSADISERASDDGATVSRNGAGFGWLSIACLALLGFVRRK